jgi:hypothetical protein
MRGLRVWILALLLAAMGFTIASYKYQVLEFPLTPDTTYNSWYLEARVDVRARNPWRKGDKPLIVNMRLPNSSTSYAVVDENIVARGFGHEIDKDEKTGTRTAVFSKRKIAARETIFYRATLFQLDSPASVTIDAPKLPNSPYAKRNRPKLQEGEDKAPLYVAMDALIEEAREKSASDSTFVREIYRLVSAPEDDRIRVIRDTLDVNMHASDLAAMLLELGDIPVRNAHGVQLSADKRNAQFVRWLEVFLKGKWMALDPETNQFGLRAPYMVWWYGDNKFLSVEGNARVDHMIAVRKITNNALTRAMWKSDQLADILHHLSFYNLPLDTQLVFSVLLMLPIGGLVLAFLRQVIGLKTFGTFMPVLIAIAFRETGLLSGITLFVVVVAIGLLIRNYFHHLKLLMVPRLAAVLTVVVIVLSLITLLAHQLGWVVGLSIALFPIVILTMTIERMTLIWEEHGAEEAMKIGAQSLIASVVAYVAMNSDMLGHIIFVFPELLLVVLALTMLIGRYNHYKLTEYMRFRQLQRSLRARERESEGNE